MPAPRLLVSKDTWIDAYYSNTNYGSTTSIAVNGTTGQNSPQWALIGNLPSDILSLFLFCGGKRNNGNLLVYKVTSQWDELTVTWNTRPSIESTPIVTIPASNIIVNNWVEIPLNRNLPYGIMLQSTLRDSLIAITFNSHEAATNKPYYSLSPPTLALYDFQTNFLFSSAKDSRGNTLDLLQIVAGNISEVKPIGLWNGCSFSLQNIIVWLENIFPGDVIEISKSNSPFIASSEIHFDGVFAPSSDIGTFYVRVKPGEDGSGSKSFTIKAKATPV